MRSVNWLSRTNGDGATSLGGVRLLAGVTLVVSPRCRVRAPRTHTQNLASDEYHGDPNGGYVRASTMDRSHTK